MFDICICIATFVYFFHLTTITYQLHMKNRHVHVFAWQKRTDTWVTMATIFYVFFFFTCICASGTSAMFFTLIGFSVSSIVTWVMCRYESMKTKQEQKYAEICESIDLLTEKIETITDNLNHLQGMKIRITAPSAQNAIQNAIDQHQQLRKHYTEIRDLLTAEKYMTEAHLDMDRIVLPDLSDKQSFLQERTLHYFLNNSLDNDQKIATLLQKYS